MKYLIGFLLGVAVTLFVQWIAGIVEEESNYFDMHDHDQR